MIKKAVREFTPPILSKAASKLKQTAGLGRSPQWKQGVEQPAEFYDWSFENSAHWQAHYTASRYYPLWTVIADRIRTSRAQSVLDIGCGPGQVACLLADKGLANYRGIDFSAARIEQARIVCPSFHFEAVDVFATQTIEEAPYDLVLVMEFLEHVDRDIQVLHRVRPGTRVIATVPNFPATGHVRYFENIAEVERRYTSCFSSLDVDALLANKKGKKYYLMDGFIASR